jgi:hypothetical protein
MSLFPGVFMSTDWKWKVLGLAACLLITGCHPGTENMIDLDPGTRHEQIGLGQLYQTYAMATKINGGVPPRRFSDLKQLGRIHPETLKSLRNGAVIIVWGVEQDAASAAILAYERNAPKQGGQVLTANGNIGHMTAPELLTALKSRG